MKATSFRACPVSVTLRENKGWSSILNFSGAAKSDSDFIDISDADSQVQQPLREVLLWAGFATNFDKTGLKLLPCPPGTFVNISDSIPRCIDCPAGKP